MTEKIPLKLGRRFTEAEVEARRADVRQALARGKWSKRKAAEIAQVHGVETRTVFEQDRAAVMKQLREECAIETHGEQVAVWHEQVNELYRDAMNDNDRANAAKALALKAKALGVETKRVEHSGSVGVQVTEEHVKAAIREMLTQDEP